MFRALGRIHQRMAVRKFENIDERARRLAPMKKVRFRIITFAFSLASAVTGLLFMTQRTADHQLYLGVTWAAFASAVIGAQFLFWSNRAGPAIDNVYIVNGMPEHRPPLWGPILGTIAALTLRVLGALLIVGFVAATFWTAWSALKPVPPVEPLAPAEPVASTPEPLPPPTPLTATVATKDIVDGDTFDVGTTRIRPLGNDTPEEGKRCEGPAGRVGVRGLDMLVPLLRRQQRSNKAQR